MELKKLDVPTSSITEVKKSPMSVFQQAREANNGVYVFNREKVAGVVLTQELYEGLIEELAQLRQQQVTETLITESALSEELAELAQELNHYLVKDAIVPAKYLDERMVALGFITKKTGFGGVTEMLRELKETGKLTYQLRKRQGQLVYAQVIGEVADDQADKILIAKIHLINR